LLEPLFATIARERRYARDLAHELRTPMAETRAIAEVALLTGDHEALRHSLTEIAAIGAEMQRVVETLLMLARYEAGMDRLIAEPVELVALVRAQLRRLDDGIRGKRIRFVLSLPQEAWVLADASACERILSNLLGNAVAHAPENSVASIDLFDKGGGYQLLIGNAAPRLRSDDMAQLSGRFYRGDAPPNRHHAGLGLALALALAKAQGLAMQWQLDEGLRFQVSLRGFAPLPD